MNKQEIFDKVANHLLKQNERSEKLIAELNGFEGTACMYRGPNGLKCAAGCLIPDELYNPSFELNTVCSNKMIKVFESLGISDSELIFLNDLQLIHDCEQCKDWKSALTKRANQHNLNKDVLDS